MDYQTGELWFEPVNGPPRIIPSTSTIAVSYQSSGYYSNAGTLSGARAEFPVAGTRGLLGFTYLRQDRPEAGQGDTAGYQEDIYQGSGTTGPFDTNFRPIVADGATVVYHGESQTIAKALVVLVDNAEQIASMDYDDYRQIGRVIFRRAVPPTSLVRIQYYYSLGQPQTAGDLDTLGVDLSYRLSPDLALVASAAHSQGGSSGVPGNALSATLAYSRHNLNFSAKLIDMDPTYSFMDTVGFFRSESGLNWRLDWRPLSDLTVYDVFSDVKTDSGLAFGYSGWGRGQGSTGVLSAWGLQPSETSPGLDVRARQHSYGLSWEHPRWPRLTFTHDSMSNSGGSLSGSDYGSDRLTLSHEFSPRLRTQAQWQWNTQQYMATSGDTTSALGSRSLQGSYGLTYAVSDALAFSANFNDNFSRGSAVTAGAEPTTSAATALQFSARWTPSRKLSLNLNRTVTSSNGAVSSGFYGSHSGSVLTAISLAQDSTDEQPHYEDNSTNLSISYQPMDRLSLNLGLSQRRYLSGGGLGYLANSNQNTQNLFLTWRLTPQLSLTGGLGNDQLSFLDAGRGSVSNRMYTAAVTYQPPNEPWGLSLALNRQTGASPTYINFGSRQRYLMVDTDLTDITSQLRYRLGERGQLYATLGLSDFSSGYAAFTKQNAELGWQMELNETTRVDLGYRFIRNLAGQPTSPLFPSITAGQDYMANTFMVTLNTSFGGGSGGGGGRFSGPSSGYFAQGGSRGGGMGGSFGGGYGGTGLATFGGYSPGSGQSSYGGTGGGFGLGSSGFGGGTYVPGSGSTGGLSTGLGGFSTQRQPGAAAPPSLGWGAPPTRGTSRGQPGESAAGEETQAWDNAWSEAISRWDLPPAEQDWW